LNSNRAGANYASAFFGLAIIRSSSVQSVQSVPIRVNPRQAVPAFSDHRLEFQLGGAMSRRKLFRKCPSPLAAKLLTPNTIPTQRPAVPRAKHQRCI